MATARGVVPQCGVLPRAFVDFCYAAGRRTHGGPGSSSLGPAAGITKQRLFWGLFWVRASGAWKKRHGLMFIACDRLSHSLFVWLQGHMRCLAPRHCDLNVGQREYRGFWAEKTVLFMCACGFSPRAPRAAKIRGFL